MTNRRALVSHLALGICAAPLAALAQTPGKTVRIGILSSAAANRGDDEMGKVWVTALGDLGWVTGQNMVFERRYADGKADLLAGFAGELVQAKVDIIATFSSTDAAAAMRATSAIPVVMVFNGLDPVQEGFVASFAKPGGHVTGVSRMLAETRAKRLELIKAMLPSAGRIAVLAWPESNPDKRTRFETALHRAARALQTELQFFYYKDQNELAAAFPAMVGARVQAFLLEPTFQTFANRERIAQAALKHRLPGIFTLAQYAAAGGLLSYGPDWPTMMRQHARFVDRILRGASPGDLPLEQPMKFELVVNLNTAKALGLAIPQPLLLRADAVIQ